MRKSDALSLAGDFLNFIQIIRVKFFNFLTYDKRSNRKQRGLCKGLALVLKSWHVQNKNTKGHQRRSNFNWLCCLCVEENRNLLKCSWILLRMFMLILLSTMLMAKPLLPNRPVRPILCRYVSLSGLPSLSTGKSKLITTETCSTSIPGCGRQETDKMQIRVCVSVKCS